MYQIIYQTYDFNNDDSYYQYNCIIISYYITLIAVLYHYHSHKLKVVAFTRNLHEMYCVDSFWQNTF